MNALRANYDNLVLDYEQLRRENAEMELKLKEKNDLDEFEALERKTEKDQEVRGNGSMKLKSNHTFKRNVIILDIYISKGDVVRIQPFSYVYTGTEFNKLFIYIVLKIVKSSVSLVFIHKKKELKTSLERFGESAY